MEPRFYGQRRTKRLFDIKRRMVIKKCIKFPLLSIGSSKDPANLVKDARYRTSWLPLPRTARDWTFQHDNDPKHAHQNV